MKQTIEIDDMLYEVEYSIEEEEKEVRYYGDGSGHPGSPRKKVIDYIFIKSGDNIGEQCDDEEVIKQIEDRLINIED